MLQEHKHVVDFSASPRLTRSAFFSGFLRCGGLSLRLIEQTELQDRRRIKNASIPHTRLQVPHPHTISDYDENTKAGERTFLPISAA
jgi:hypothetical protein